MKKKSHLFTTTLVIAGNANISRLSDVAAANNVPLSIAHACHCNLLSFELLINNFSFPGTSENVNVPKIWILCWIHGLWSWANMLASHCSIMFPYGSWFVQIYSNYLLLEPILESLICDTKNVGTSNLSSAIL